MEMASPGGLHQANEREGCGAGSKHKDGGHSSAETVFRSQAKQSTAVCLWCQASVDSTVTKGNNESCGQIREQKPVIPKGEVRLT